MSFRGAVDLVRRELGDTVREDIGIIDGNWDAIVEEDRTCCSDCTDVVVSFRFPLL